MVWVGELSDIVELRYEFLCVFRVAGCLGSYMLE